MQHTSSLSRKGKPGFSFSIRLFLPFITAFLWLSTVELWKAAPPAAAQTKTNPEYNIKLNARSFFDGNFKYGDWLPVEVTLENFGEAQDTSIETQITSFYNGSSFNTVFRRDISLGQRSNKKIILYIQPFVQTTNVSRSVSYDAQVQLKIDGQKVAEKAIKLQPVNPQDYLVGAIVTDNSALVNLNNLKIGPMRSRVTVVPLGLNDIPDRVEGLRSLNALLISDTATESLTGSQRATLKNWVGTGGQLLLMGGNGWGRVREAFDSSMLPFDVLDYTNLTDLTGLLAVPGDKSSLPKPVAIARGQTLQGATTLNYTTLPGSAVLTPLLAEKRLGAGRVLASALDLVSPALVDWANTSRIWQDLFNFNAGVYNALYSEQNPQLKNASDMLSFIASVPELSLPDMLPYLLLLAGYILVISPVNFLFLRRVGHLEWAWLTIPLSIVIATGLTLILSKKDVPGQVIINQMSLVQVSPGSENAQVRSYAAIFSPDDIRYKVSPVLGENNQGSLLLPLIRPSTNSGVNEGEIPRVVVQGERARLDDFPVGQWGAQGFSTETSLPARNFQVASNLYFQRDKNQPDQSKIAGSIRNTTAFSIKNAILILNDQAVKLKDSLEPGEVVPVEFNLNSPSALVPAYCSNSYTSYGSFPPQTPGDRISNLLTADRTDRKDDKLLSNRAGFLKKVFDSGRYSPLNPSRGLDLVGWISDNPLPLQVDGFTTQAKTNQVLVNRLTISDETRDGESRLFIPGTFLWPVNTVNEAGLSALTSRPDIADEVCISKGSVTATYRLPADQGPFRLKKLTLYLNSFASTSQRPPQLPGRIELYDFKAGKWQNFEGLKNSALAPSPSGGGSTFNIPPAKPNEIPDPSRFVEAETGRVFLKLTEESSTNLLTHFTFSFEGS